MTAYTDFHYSPTGSGVISGSQVLEQTEQGINGLGQYVQDNISGAIDTANQALTIAQTANTNATTALNTANSFSDAITTANQTANNALTTAQSAQSTANAASSLATTANNNATTALNTANAASAGVTTLTGTVNSLGNRMTAAENAINANAGNITTLQTNLQTTNNNVTAAANAASAAQATATSAQSTATLARNQAYVLRYTGTTITGGGTIAYADIDNTDNIKAGDKIIDATGAVYDIASVDTTNQTVTVGASPVINLFCDAENLIPAANDAYDLGSASKQWLNTYSKGYYYNGTAWGLDKQNEWTNFQRMTSNPAVWYLRNNTVTLGTVPSSNRYIGMFFEDVNGADLGYATFQANKNSYNSIIFNLKNYDGTNTYTGGLRFRASTTGAYSFFPEDSECDLGISTNKWKTLNGVNPGALSLPDKPGGSGTVNVNYFDLSGNVTVKDGSTYNSYTALCDGWIVIGSFASEISIEDDTTNLAITVVPKSNGYAQAYLPVRQGDTVRITINQTNTQYQNFKLIPCQGNI